MTHFKDSKTTLIAEVDCKDAGQTLCEENGIKDFPTMLFGDPYNLRSFSKDRSYGALKSFAEKYVKPHCGPWHRNLCDPDTIRMIEQFERMPSGELDAAIEEKLAERRKIREEYSAFVDDLNKRVQEAGERKAEAVEASQKSLPLIKGVLWHARRAPKREEREEL